MKSQRRALFGLLLILIGVVLLLDNLNVIPGLPDYVFNWRNIFLLIAIINVMSGNLRGALVLGAIWGFFMFHEYWDLDLRDYWPLILVVIGLGLMLRKGPKGPRVVADEYFDELNVFGGSSKAYNSQNLRGGKVTNIFGGSDIDLREAKAPEGATIEVFTMFGGCDLIVPRDWNVSVNTTAIFGGFDDRREVAPSTDGPTIYIKGLTLFGGGELKNVK